MEKKFETASETEAKKKADAKASLWFGIIFGMVAIEIYGEQVSGAGHRAPADAADR
jgi:hypothetical protein